MRLIVNWKGHDKKDERTVEIAQQQTDVDLGEDLVLIAVKIHSLHDIYAEETAYILKEGVNFSDSKIKEFAIRQNEIIAEINVIISKHPYLVQEVGLFNPITV